MNLTEFFYSLGNIDQPYNKYAAYSLAFNNPYRIATGYDAFKYNFDPYMKQFIAEQGKCIAMPSFMNGEVISIMFRAITSKQFRYYTECKYIPYGAGTNEKQFYKPWLIVESALDKVKMLEKYDFNDIVISIKSSDVLMSDKLKLIYRLFPQKWAFGIFSLFYSHHR